MRIVLGNASPIGQRSLAQGKNIKIELDDSTHDYIQVCYDESLMIRRLSAYPYIQFGVVHALCGYSHLCFAYFQESGTE